MPNNNQSLTLTAWGKDMLSGPMKEAGKAVGKLPEQLSKAQGAMNALGGAAAEIGGPVAQVTGKLSGLAAIVSTGGPLGLGLAALTAAVSAGVVIWDTWHESTRAVESATKSLGGMFDAQRKGIDDTKKSITELEKGMRAFGLSSKQAQINEIDLALERSANGAEVFAKEVKALDEESSSLSASLKKWRAEMNAGNFANADAAQKAENQIAINKMQSDAFKRSADSLAIKRSEQEREIEVLVDAMTIERQSAEEDRKGKVAKDGLTKAAKEHKKEVHDLVGDLKSYIAAMRERAEAEREATRGKVEEGFKSQMLAASEYYSKVADLREKDIKRAESVAETQVAAYERVGDAMGAQLGAAIAGQKTAEAAFKSMAVAGADAVIGMAQRAIMAYAAEAAAAAFAANAGIPIIGPFVGAAAAAAALSAVRAYLGQVGGMAEGGLVTGGERGKDSVLKRLMPGELVLPVDVTNQLLSLAGKPGARAMSGGGRVTRDSGAGTTMVVNYHFNGLRPINSAEVEKDTMRVQGRALQDLVRKHQLKLRTA